MQRAFLLVLGLLGAATAFAQRQNVYFFKNNGKEVNTKDSADYIRIITPPDSGTLLYNISEYYAKTGKVKFLGKNAAPDQLFLVGRSISFYPTGKKKLVGSYDDNNLVGDVYQFYPNGQLCSAVNFSEGRQSLMSCNDSTGHALSVNGNGHFVIYDDDFKNILHEGDVRDGKATGNWTSRLIVNNDQLDLHYSIIYQDQYEDGVLISRKTLSSTYNPETDSKKIMIRIQAEFPGGEAALGRFLQKNIHYSAAIKKSKLLGKVYLEFFIEPDGSVSDIRAVVSPNDDLAKEAIRVMGLTPHWKPAVIDGKPVRVKHITAVNFELGN